MRPLAAFGATTLILLAGCDPPPATGSVGLTGLLNPITEVEVYVATLGAVLEVGDTTQVTAEGFHNGSGFGTQLPQTVAFAVDDSTIASLEKASWVNAIIPAASARGRRPGVARVSVTINGVTGRDTILVIPTIGSIVVAPTSVTVHTNDTVSFHVTVFATDGTPITNVHPFTQAQIPGLATIVGRDLYRALKPGTTAITTT